MTEQQRIERLEAKIKHLVQDYEKELHNLREFKKMVLGLRLGILEVDNKDSIVYVNEGFTQLTGYTSKDLLGRKAREVFIDTQSKIDELRLTEQEQLRRQGAGSVYELPIKKKDGTTIWLSISGVPKYNDDGEVIGSVGIHYDISRQKRLQQALQEAREESDRAKHAEERFLAKMSHEIRTPLNAVIGMSYLLKGTNITGEQKEYVEVIARSGNLLLNLINDVLDYSKVSTGQVEPRNANFSLETTLNDIAQTFRLKTQDRDVSIVLNYDWDGDMVIGDETLLNQVLMNLMGNADKFTDEGSIALDLVALAEYDGNVTLQFTISDTGIGISPDKLESIFQEFVQEEGIVLGDGRGGTGLGLAITKKIIEVLGGKVWAESDVGRGTKMHFVLSFREGKPLKDQPPTNPSTVANTPSDTLEEIDTNIRILIAEDNAMNQKYISRILERKGLHFEIASNGKIAVKLADSEHFDVIFMDLFMPVMNGFDAAKKIVTESSKNAHTPIYALTATAVKDHKKKAINCGMQGFISKPFHPNEIFSVLGQIKRKTENLSHHTLMLPEDNEITFQYSDIFEQETLDTYYGTDVEYAMEMFTIFYEQLQETAPLIIEALHNENRTALRHVVHKLKPTFTMVGLPKLTHFFEAWEQSIDESSHTFGHFHGLWKEVQDEVTAAGQLVNQEIERMKIFIARSNS